MPADGLRHSDLHQSHPSRVPPRAHKQVRTFVRLLALSLSSALTSPAFSPRDASFPSLTRDTGPPRTPWVKKNLKSSSLPSEASRTCSSPTFPTRLSSTHLMLLHQHPTCAATKLLLKENSSQNQLNEDVPFFLRSSSSHYLEFSDFFEFNLFFPHILITPRGSQTCMFPVSPLGRWGGAVFSLSLVL